MKAIQPNELRIGNYVKHNVFGNCIITALDFEMICIQRTDLDIKEWLDLDFFKPIPLTEEWLVKLNFTEVFEGHFESPNEMIIVSFNPLKVSIICPMPWIEVEDCQFVHELQNLHFALSKTEINFDI